MSRSRLSTSETHGPRPVQGDAEVPNRGAVRLLDAEEATVALDGEGGVIGLVQIWEPVVEEGARCPSGDHAPVSSSPGAEEIRVSVPRSSASTQTSSW